MALRWCAAGMLGADHQFRRVNGHLHLPKLRAALEAHFTGNVRPQARVRITTRHDGHGGPPPKFHGTRDNLQLQVSTDSLYKRWRAWGLPGIHVGRLLRFRERDINTWLEKHAA